MKSILSLWRSLAAFLLFSLPIAIHSLLAAMVMALPLARERYRTRSTTGSLPGRPGCLLLCLRYGSQDFFVRDENLASPLYLQYRPKPGYDFATGDSGLLRLGFVSSKHEMAILETDEAACMDNGAVPVVAHASSYVSASTALISSTLSPLARSFHTYNVSKEDDDLKLKTPECPDWLLPLIQHKWRAPVVALAYQISSSESGNQYATLTPLVCSYHKLVGVSQYDSKLASIGTTNSDVSAVASAVAKHKAYPFDTTPRLGKVPLEVWERIMDSLSCEDTKNLRLVSKDLERCTSARLFRSIVVPFTAEVYGALAEPFVPHVGMKTSRDTTWQPESCKADVFRGFGPHVRKFGMTFEVDKHSLSNPPNKKLRESHETYWGPYSWPLPEYARYQKQAALEVCADETSTMTLAFSHLTGVTHLALSLDCGLGWLPGPDLSIRANILQSPPAIFGLSFCQGSDLLAKRQLWTILEEAYRTAGYSNLWYEQLVRSEVPNPSQLRKMIQGGPTIQAAPRLAFDASLNSDYVEKGIDSPMGSHSNLPTNSFGAIYISSALQIPEKKQSEEDGSEEYEYECKKVIPDFGLLYTRPICHREVTNKPPRPAFIPNRLSAQQMEWLLETSWGQDAFFSSYLLAVADNSSAFQNVTTLTITRVSARHLTKLYRDDFWAALGSLKELDLRIIADYRDVLPGEAGFVGTTSILPSDAVHPFYKLLTNHIAQKASIKSLCVGWADGGEHAEGIYARNDQILPAPILGNPLNSNEESWYSDMLRLPHVENLTLLNCWVTPNALEAMLRHGYFLPELRHLRLESVSLTTHLGFESLCETKGLKGFLVQQLANYNLKLPVADQSTAMLQARRMVTLLDKAHAFTPGPQNYMNDPNGKRAAEWAIYDAILENRAGNLPDPQPAERLHGFRPRVGSWPYVINRITKAQREDWAKAPIRFSFLSCGYVHLRKRDMEQKQIDAAHAAHRHVAPMTQYQEYFFYARRSVLFQFMMPNLDPMTGYIVYGFTPNETETLESVWGLEKGWPTREMMGEEEWQSLNDGGWGKWTAKSKLAALYDGVWVGGTGRFSGVIDETPDDEDPDAIDCE